MPQILFLMFQLIITQFEYCILQTNWPAAAGVNTGMEKKHVCSFIQPKMEAWKSFVNWVYITLFFCLCNEKQRAIEITMTNFLPLDFLINKKIIPVSRSDWVQVWLTHFLCAINQASVFLGILPGGRQNCKVKASLIESQSQCQWFHYSVAIMNNQHVLHNDILKHCVSPVWWEDNILIVLS